MARRIARSIPSGLVAVRKQIQQWRRSHSCGGRIPEALWASAVRVASEHGVDPAARQLGLNAESLTKRVEAAKRAVPTPAARGSFIELLPPGCRRECDVELQTPSGSKLRIVIKGDGVDVAGLIERFWQVAS